jgi:hypothetical protein
MAHKCSNSCRENRQHCTVCGFLSASHTLGACPTIDLPRITALYRKDGPDTSRLAAEGNARSGNMASRKALALQQVVACPGKTAGEIAEALGWDRATAGQSLDHLHRSGAVAQGEARRCTAKGTFMMTWWPTRGR